MKATADQSAHHGASPPASAYAITHHLLGRSGAADTSRQGLADGCWVILTSKSGLMLVEQEVARQDCERLGGQELPPGR